MKQPNLTDFKARQQEDLNCLQAFHAITRYFAWNVYGDLRFTKRRKALYDAIEAGMPKVYEQNHDDGMLQYCQDIVDACEAAIAERERYCELLRIPKLSPPSRTLFTRATKGMEIAKNAGLLKKGSRACG